MISLLQIFYTIFRAWKPRSHRWVVTFIAILAFTALQLPVTMAWQLGYFYHQPIILQLIKLHNHGTIIWFSGPTSTQSPDCSALWYVSGFNLYIPALPTLMYVVCYTCWILTVRYRQYSPTTCGNIILEHYSNFVTFILIHCLFFLQKVIFMSSPTAVEVEIVLWSSQGCDILLTNI